MRSDVNVGRKFVDFVVSGGIAAGGAAGLLFGIDHVLALDVRGRSNNGG